MSNLKPINCPDCGDQQHSQYDQDYLERYNNCWGCDKELWHAGEISLEEFENREQSVSKA